MHFAICTFSPILFLGTMLSNYEQEVQAHSEMKTGNFRYVALGQVTDFFS